MEKQHRSFLPTKGSVGPVPEPNGDKIQRNGNYRSMRAFEILWIALFRFQPVARVWAVCLILVNLGSLFFLDTIYAQMNLAAIGLGIALMIFIYQRVGFARLLGIGHILWVPMIAYFLMNLPDAMSQPTLYVWVVALIVFNTVSLVIDSIDVLRFLRGERAPHYTW